jgi:hypothetical protein
LDAPVGLVGGLIWYPEFHIVLGITFVGNGLYAMARGLGLFGNSSRLFQYSIGFNYVLYLVLVVLVEMSLAPGANPGAPIATVVTLNGHVLLAFLEEKARSTPEDIRHRP